MSSASLTPGTSPSWPAVSSGLSTGAKAGVGVGVTLGVIALVGLTIFIWKALHWRRTAKSTSIPYEMPERYQQKELYYYQQDTKPVAHLAGIEDEVHEMPNSHISAPSPHT
ncbi:hypothetical protein GQ44DRAFT_777825 [Phaeosphaeriaceae sp. PMI808]|nr:hypothetical protein GQ44DRAFT_777825 [Phaeosphaeriaceae sp. PMI808]